LQKIDRFVDLSEVRAHLEPYYSEVGRPSIDPELMVRMIAGYCFGVRSERRLCEEVLSSSGHGRGHPGWQTSRRPRRQQADGRHALATCLARAAADAWIRPSAPSSWAHFALIATAPADRNRSYNLAAMVSVESQKCVVTACVPILAIAADS
jgi:hypothetical protein